jgi:hypothetical protein
MNSAPGGAVVPSREEMLQRRSLEALKEIARLTGQPLIEGTYPPIGVDNYDLSDDEWIRAEAQKEQAKKKQLPGPAYGILKRWYDAGAPENNKGLNGLTFRHVVVYLRTGQDPEGRLDVALGDIGYTREEVAGKTPQALVKEVLDRGVEADSEDDV